MDEREQLLSDLRKIKQNQFRLNEEEKAKDYVPLMLKYIGDTNPELRDYLIYKTFYKWIIEIKCLREEELRYILFTVLDPNHLFYGLEHECDDSVFTRSFSALVVALVLAYHRDKPFLEYKEFLMIKDNLINYYGKEKDLRAHVKGKGWADAVSHGADALDELIACKESNEKICCEVLGVIENMLLNGKYIFCEEEDERITCVVFRIIKDKLISDQFINKWIEGLVRHYKEKNNNIGERITRINIKNFIRSLYFRLIYFNSNLELINNVLRAETKLNSFVRAE